MSGNVNKYKKYFIIIVPILLIAVIVELILLLKPNNELKSNQVKPNYDDDIKLGDSTILFDSANVSYNNSNSGLTSNRVQDALDELYTKANSDSFWLKKYKTWAGSPTNYIFDGTNAPTTSSPTTPPSGKNVYLGLYADDQYGVCIKRNGTQHCFRYNNWIAESKHIQEVFSDISCDVDSSSVFCFASDFLCAVDSVGYVYCDDHGANEFCDVYGDSSVDCG